MTENNVLDPYPYWHPILKQVSIEFNLSNEELEMIFNPRPGYSQNIMDYQ